MRFPPWLEELREDLKIAVRQLTASPTFTFVAALTLALGIGANAAVFGVLKSVLIDALPYGDADRLTRVYGRRVDGSAERGPLSAGTVADIARRQSSFDSIATFIDLPSEAIYGTDAARQTVTIGWVSPRFFEVLRVAALRGRTFRDTEGADGMVALSGGLAGVDTAPVVILPHASWRRLFGGDSTVIGRSVRINGRERTVIGVLPPEFVGPMGPVDFYFAFDLEPVIADPIAGRGAHWLGLVGRLKPGRTHEAAHRDMASIGAELSRQYPRENGTLGVRAMPLRDALVGDRRTPLVVLMSSAALVLLIACANLAGALLSRTLTRRREFAVRMALGARRSRLVRQVLTETCVLACVGGAAGLVLAVLLLDGVRDLALPALPVYARLSLDAGAVVMTTTLALLTGVTFGVVPAAAASRTDSEGALRGESRALSESRRSGRLRGAFVTGQMALCISLLAGAGLLSRSLWEMTTAPLGFEPAGVLTAGVQPPAGDYPTRDARIRFYDQLVERMRAIPGVEAAASASAIPTAVRQRLGLRVEGAQPEQAPPLAAAALVSDDYFTTLRIPLRAGRTFDARDRQDAPATAIISESAARRFWPGGDALGGRIRLGADNPDAPLIEVVGIVGDVRNDRVRPDAEPMVYRPNRQVGPPATQILLRTADDPLALVPAVERELAALDRGIPLQRPTTLRAVAAAGLTGRQLPVLLMTAFGALSLLLASVGVYAMFTSMASAREREFGVRMALGSRRAGIALLVLLQGAGWMAGGFAIGAMGILGVVRLVGGLLYGVRPFDPLTLGAAAATLVACATVALLIPVYRATRVDPAIALRAE